MPVAFGPECVEGPILLRGVGVFKVVKAIECVEAEVQGKRGRSKFTCGHS